MSSFVRHLEEIHGVTLKSKGERTKKKVRRNSNRSPTPDDAALRNPDAKIVKRAAGDFQCPHCDHVCAVYGNMQVCGLPESWKRLQKLPLSSRSKFKVHVNVKHLGIREYRCSLCEYAAGQKVHLYTHMERVHNGGGGDEDEDAQELLDEEEPTVRLNLC